MSIEEIAVKAKSASIKLAAVSTERKDKALGKIAEALKANSERIVAANKKDLKLAEENDLAKPLLKRLKFDEKKLGSVCEGIASLQKLEDPTGKKLFGMELDEGLELYKVSCPIGVIGVIFESRPDALVQISTLCLKSGNGVLLKGGSEAENTNRVLAEVISEASEEAGMPAGWLQLLTTREDVKEMLGLDDYIDLVIPRGSNEFVRFIMEHTNIAVLGHSEGICHVYVDSEADLEMAAEIVADSKCQYVAVCNAVETLLVDDQIAGEFLPVIQKVLEKEGVELRGCEKTRQIIDCRAATEEDWRTEYLDLILSVKVVDCLDEAIGHINCYGSHHTDAIVTSNKDRAESFMGLVDSADVFWNCSTRFSDGYRYGLGAEVGISTNKIHARGPVGLEGLVIYKWKLYGRGQVVRPYANGEKKFRHGEIKD